MATTNRPAAKRALQLKVLLRHTSPPIRRRILVRDDLTFWDLHVAIQDAMGWWDHDVVLEKLAYTYDFEPGPRPR